MFFLGGLVSGLVLSQYWRPLTKTGIKLGIRAGHKAREFSQQAMEDIGDLTAEATEELRAEEAARARFEQEPEVTYEQEQEIN